jgi:hypothetical protein
LERACTHHQNQPKKKKRKEKKKKNQQQQQQQANKTPHSHSGYVLVPVLALYCSQSYVGRHSFKHRYINIMAFNIFKGVVEKAREFATPVLTESHFYDVSCCIIGFGLVVEP